MTDLINNYINKIKNTNSILNKKAANLQLVNSKHNKTQNNEKDYFDSSSSKNKKILRYSLLGLGLVFTTTIIVKRKSILKIFSNFYKKSNKKNISEETSKIIQKTEEKTDSTPTKSQLPSVKDLNELHPADKIENAKNISVIPQLPENFKSECEKRSYFNCVRLKALKNEASLKDAIGIIKKVGFQEFFDIKKDNTPFRFKHNTKIFDTCIVNKDMPKNLFEDYIKCFDDYVKIKPKEVSESVIQKVFYPWDRENLQSAINSIKDEQQKIKMQDLFNQREKDLFKTQIDKDIQDILALMKKYLYGKSYLSEEEKKQITEKFGKHAASYIANSANPLSEESAMSIAKMIAFLEPDDFEFCKNNLDKIIMLNKSGSFIGNSDYSESYPTNSSIKLIVNSIKTFFENDKAKEYLEDVIAYSNLSKYDTINGVLRFRAKLNEILASFTEKKLPNSLNVDIDELSTITNKIFNLGKPGSETQEILENLIKSIREDIKSKTPKEIYQKLNNLKDTLENLYKGTKIEKHTNNLKELLNVNITKLGSTILTRGEHTDIFSSLSLNGKKLSELMLDKNEAKNVVEFLNKTKPTLTQSGFTSTSVYPFSPFKKRKIYWFLTPNETTKGMYINDIRNLFEYSGYYNGSEAEILIMPNAKIKIDKVKYNNGQYKIYGTINN